MDSPSDNMPLLVSCKTENCPSYLGEVPMTLSQSSCDILLKLDDGNELPAHSQILARFMPVFAGMVEGGHLSGASPTNVVTVPFSECSLVEAGRFLSIVYLGFPKQIDDASALSIAGLSHKYGCKDMLGMCDDALAMKAGVNSSNPDNFPGYLKGQDIDVFFRDIKSAAMFDMPKLLACYEHYIALHRVDVPDSVLCNRCRREQQLTHSFARIAEGVNMAFDSLKSRALREEQCRCHYGDSDDRDWYGRVCKLFGLFDVYEPCCGKNSLMTSSEIRGLVPTPMEFLKMAEGDNACM